MVTLQDAVDDLYRVVVTERKPTSTKRLDVLARLCVQELAKRQVPDVLTEVDVPGFVRDKKWDVAWLHAGRVRLGVSLKSILGNVTGTVPNRTDDLMGEMANVQLWSPEIVTGYVVLFNVDQNRKKGDGPRQEDGKLWSQYFAENVEKLSGRSAPGWVTSMIEATAFVRVDFSTGAALIAPQNLDSFFDQLADCLKQRFPEAFS